MFSQIGINDLMVIGAAVPGLHLGGHQELEHLVVLAGVEGQGSAGDLGLAAEAAELAQAGLDGLFVGGLLVDYPLVVDHLGEEVAVAGDVSEKVQNTRGGRVHYYIRMLRVVLSNNYIYEKTTSSHSAECPIAMSEPGLGATPFPAAECLPDREVPGPPPGVIPDDIGVVAGGVSVRHPLQCGVIRL